MKKILLMAFVAIAALSSCQSPESDNAVKPEAREISLKEAFAELSKVQNVTPTTPDYNFPVVADVIRDGQIAAAYNLDSTKIKASADEAFTILDKVSLGKMINGGANGEVAAFVYSEPDNEGSNDALIAVMSGYKGSIVFMYGKIDDASKVAIQNAPLLIQGINLSLETTLADGNEFNIMINKGR